MVSSKEAGIFPTVLMASPAASLAWPYKSCTLPSACCIWPRTGVLASPVARPKASSTFPPRFLAVPLKRFSSIVMLQRFGYLRLSRWARSTVHPSICPSSDTGNDAQSACKRLVGASLLQSLHRDAIDLCDVLSSFNSQGKASLHEVCRVMGLPGKPDGIRGEDALE